MSAKRDNIHAVIVAGGSGSRMGTQTKKQFLTIGGHPMLYYSLKAFEDSGAVDDVILVCAEEDIGYCKKDIVSYYNFAKVRAVTAGGATRAHSVYAGLKEISFVSSEKEKNFPEFVTGDPAEFVIIHDGARPFVNDTLIRRSIEGAKMTGACVVAVPVEDTIKVIGDDLTIIATPQRDSLMAMQTPQTFFYPLIRYAYDRMMEAEDADGVPMTDDAMVAEHYCAGVRVRIAEGEPTNKKITTQTDLIFAEAFLQSICTYASE